MDDPMPAEHMQILQAPRNTNRNLVPQRPFKGFTTLPYNIGPLLSQSFRHNFTILNFTTDWDSVYRAMPMLEFHLSRIQISGIVHSQRSIQEDMMCLGGIHVPESLVPPGTLSPSVHWACLLPASSQLHVGHQIGRPCILLHSLLFPPSYLQETIKDYRCLTYDDTVDAFSGTNFGRQQTPNAVNFCYIKSRQNSWNWMNYLYTELLIPLLYFLWCQILWYYSETISICIH